MKNDEKPPTVNGIIPAYRYRNRNRCRRPDVKSATSFFDILRNDQPRTAKLGRLNAVSVLDHITATIINQHRQHVSKNGMS